MKQQKKKNRKNKSGEISQSIIGKMMKERNVRTAVTRESHYYFFHLYFAHYVKYPTAQFQKDVFHLTESENVENIYIVSFRGSGKSTIMTMSYPIWSILGKKKKKFVVIFCQTVGQARQHMTNLKRELESNELLKNDLGPFHEEGEWGSSSLVFSKLGARITVASAEQSIRGIRHNQFRPDLVILDDVEDLMSTKTKDGRDKTYQWYTGEVIPLGDNGTEFVIVGNLLHEDSLLMRLKRELEEEKIEGEFMYCPLVDENSNIAWPGKYSDLAAIEKERKKVGNEAAWQREYLLKIIPDEEQVIFPEWIQCYDSLPEEEPRSVIIGVDPAISQKDTADYTAIVVAAIYGREETYRAYILPMIINKKMAFPETINQIKATHDTLDKIYDHVRICVENVAYQQAIIDQLKNEFYPAEGVKLPSDKHSSLVAVSPLIQSGKIVFPKKGVDELTRQLVGFGKERYDDLADAFSIVAHKIIEEDKPSPKITFIDIGPRRNLWQPLFGSRF